jgi:hypothetical protein
MLDNALEASFGNDSLPSRTQWLVESISHHM